MGLDKDEYSDYKLDWQLIIIPDVDEEWGREGERGK